MIYFQLQVDKNCNATPNAPQQIQQTGPPGSSVNQNVSASLTSNAIRQSADPQNPHLHYINMQKQGTINSGGVTNKVVMCDISICYAVLLIYYFFLPQTYSELV